jgi:hypothetical protein
MGTFEERFAAVGRGIDRVWAKLRGGMERRDGKPLVDMEAVREKVDYLKEGAVEQSGVAAAWFKRLPKFGMLSVVLGAACVVLLLVVIVQWQSGGPAGASHKATNDEVATMSALRAKMDTRGSATGGK